MSFVAVNFSSQSLMTMAVFASSDSSSLGDNVLAAAQEANVVGDDNQDTNQLLVELLAPRLREVGTLYHVRTAAQVPGDERNAYFHERITAGLKKVPLAEPSPQDPTGKRYYRELARALIDELRDSSAALIQESQYWKNEVEKLTERIERIPVKEIIAEDLTELPIKLLQSSLTRVRKLEILHYLWLQLEILEDPLKGIPLRTALIVAASELNGHELASDVFEQLRVMIQESKGKNSALLVLFEALELFRGYEAAAEYASRALSLLQEMLMSMKSDKKKFEILGRASQQASLLDDQSRAFLFAEKQIDLAFILIQRQAPRKTRSPDDTIGFEDFSDLHWIARVFRDGRRHLGAALLFRLLEHADKVAESLKTADLRRRVPQHLKTIRENLPRA